MKNSVKIQILQGYVVDEEKSSFTEIVFKKSEGINTLEDIFRLNNMTKKDFNKKWENFEEVDKYSALERMIVKAYNGNWQPNWNNSSEYKYYPYFYMEDFRLYSVNSYYSASYFPAALCFKSEEDCGDAVSKFINIFKQSRLGV